MWSELGFVTNERKCGILIMEGNVENDQGYEWKWLRVIKRKDEMGWVLENMGISPKQQNRPVLPYLISKCKAQQPLLEKQQIDEKINDGKP